MGLGLVDVHCGCGWDEDRQCADGSDWYEDTEESDAMERRGSSSSSVSPGRMSRGFALDDEANSCLRERERRLRLVSTEGVMQGWRLAQSSEVFPNNRHKELAISQGSTCSWISSEPPPPKKEE